METHWDEHVVFKLLILMTCWMPNAISEATLGYLGCYHRDVISEATIPQGKSYNTSTVDECLLRCRDELKFYAAISGHKCVCRNSLENKGTNQEAVGNRCDIFCDEDPQLICGGTNHYSVFNTTTGICPPLVAPVNGGISHILFRVGGNVTFTCLPGYDLIGPMFMHCSVENATAIWKGTVPTCEPRPYNQTSIWESVWVRVVIDVVSIVVGSAIIICIVFAIRSCPRRRRKGRTFTSREDFSMPDCAMSSTLNSEHSPRIRSYRNFAMSTLMRNINPPGDFDHGVPDISYDDSIMVTEFDVKPQMTSTKRRTKEKGGNTSSKNRNSTFRQSSLADPGAEPSVPLSPTTGSKNPQISSSVKSFAGPARNTALDLKPNIEQASLSPLCKSACTPNVQNMTFESPPKLKKSNVPKRSKKPLVPPPCPKPNTGFASGKSKKESTFSPNIKETKNTPSSTGSPQSVLKKDTLKPRCKSVFFQNVQKEDIKSMSGREGNAAKTFRNQDDYKANQSFQQPILKIDATNDSVSRWHDMNSVNEDQVGRAVRDEAIQKPSKIQPAVLPRPKFSRPKNRQCMSMQELD